MIILFSNYTFSQLNETKSVIDSRLISTNEIPVKVGDFIQEVKLTNIKLDTVKIWYNTENLAKLIAVSNYKKGINSDIFPNLSSHFNIGFKPTNSLTMSNKDFFYDSKLKRLIVKIYSLVIKNKLVEVQFISDFKIIKNILPQVSNW